MQMRMCAVLLVAAVSVQADEVWVGVSHALNYDGERTGVTDTCTLTIRHNAQNEISEMEVRAWAKRSGLPGIVGDFPAGVLDTLVIKAGDNAPDQQEVSLDFTPRPSLEYGVLAYTRIALEKTTPVGGWGFITNEEKYVVMGNTNGKLYAVDHATVASVGVLRRLEWECEQLAKQ